MSSEDSALEVLETQTEPTPTPHKEVRGDGHAGRDGLIDLMAEHGDINAEQAKAIKKANAPKVENKEVRLNKAGREINEQGNFVKADTHQDEPQVSDDSDPEKTEAVAVEPDELKTLAAALVRYNATKADQDALAKGDPEAVKSARHLLKIQTDNDTYREQSEANKAELETLRAQAEQQKTEAAQSTPKTEFNLDAVVKPLADTLTELHGEDQSESVRNLFTNILEQVDAKYAERDKITAATIKEQGETIKSLQRDGLDSRFQNACQTLQDEFPQLKDETLRATVMERMMQIATNGVKQYESVLEAARDATRIEVAPLILEEAKAYDKKHRKAKNNGVVDINPNVAAEPKTISRRETMLQSLRAIDTDSPDYNPSKSKEIASKAAEALRSKE